MAISPPGGRLPHGSALGISHGRLAMLLHDLDDVARMDDIPCRC